ncbi:MAG: DRTGG domain-containing protein [Peptococcaceae bacterium]
MKLAEIIRQLKLEIITGKKMEQEVKGVYICDLLSNVMAHGKQGDLWVTIQTHQNIVAVASLLNFAAIIIPENLEPDEITLEKAATEEITILRTVKDAYHLAGELYQLGLRGNR